MLSNRQEEYGKAWGVPFNFPGNKGAATRIVWLNSVYNKRLMSCMSRGEQGFPNYQAKRLRDA